MKQPLGIAIASTLSLPGQVERNLDQIATFARRAQTDGADLLLTPELSASGYGGYAEVLATAEVAGDGPIFRRLSELSRETGVVICAGFVEADGDKRYLAHLAVYPDGEFKVQRKHRVTRGEAPLQPVAPQLPPYSDWDGTGQPQSLHLETFEVCGAKCAMVICADMGICGLGEELRARGVRLVLCPTGAGGARPSFVTTADLQTADGRRRYMEMLERVFLPGDAPARCLEFRHTLAAVNLCGFDGQKHYHAGHGSITTAMGEVAALIPGIANLDRQRPLYAFARVDVAEVLR